VEIDDQVLDEHAAKREEYFDPAEPVWIIKGTWKSP
jgi:galactonate dehydratase